MVKIVLDAGHGGSDPGAVYEGRQEKDDNLQLVFDVGAVLENNGIDVEYTRVTDVYQSPYEKAAMANQSGADYFVSIHRNARDVPNTGGGVETLLYSTEDSVKRNMAEAINRNLEEIGFGNRGIIARPNLVVLRDTDMPALLVEAGFIDSETDNALYDANQAAIADAIAYGILQGLSDMPAQGDEAEERDTVEEVSSSRRNLLPELKESEERIPGEKEEKVPEESGKQIPKENEAGAAGKNKGWIPEKSENQMPEKDGERVSEENEKRISEKSMYRVQIGVYRNPSNARMMLNRLQIRGYRPYMIYRSGLYYVQVGAFPDLASAVAEEKRLKNSGFQTLIVS